MPRNTIANQFRQTATDEQWIELINDNSELSSEDFAKKHGFSFAAVRETAIEKGFYEPKRRPHSPTPSGAGTVNPKPLIVEPRPASIKKVARSVQLFEDIYARLQAIENDNGQYTHSFILNHLLDEALKIHGY